MDDLRIEGTISKVDDDERQVFGWASVTEINGKPVVDLQGDLLDTYELEKAAYDYVVNSRVGGEMHERIGKSAPKQIGTLIESMVITPEKIEKMGLPPETPHGWWIGFQVDKGEAGEQAWSKLKGGEYTGFSIHGLGKRQPIEKRVVERSVEEIEGWIKRMARQAKVTPEQLRDDIVAWMEKDGLDPSDDDIHNFLLAAYGGEVGGPDVDEPVGKHLIGRHNQQDHDPTKGRTHRRRDHDTGQGFREGLKGFGGGVISGGAVGAGLGRGDPHAAGAGAAAGGLLGALGGGISGAFRGARSGGDRADARREPSRSAASELEVEGFGGGNFNLDEYKFVLQDEWNNARDELDNAIKSPDLEGRARALNHPAKERMREIEREMELVEDLMATGVEKSLMLTMAAERSSGMDEFIDNVDEIAKAFEGHEEMHSYFTSVHKHLIGNHRQKDHDPTKGRRSGDKSHARSQHGTKQDPDRIEGGRRVAAGVGSLALGWPMIASTVRGTSVFGRKNKQPVPNDRGPSPMDAFEGMSGLSHEEAITHVADRSVEMGLRGKDDPIMRRDILAVADDHAGRPEAVDEWMKQHGSNKSLSKRQVEILEKSSVHKHLIGRHEQKDHDPNKKGKKRSHSRKDHDSIKALRDKAKSQLKDAIASGDVGEATRSRRAKEALDDHYRGKTTRQQLSSQVSDARSAGARMRQAQKEGRVKTSKSLNDQQIRVLEKYLGEEAL